MVYDRTERYELPSVDITHDIVRKAWRGIHTICAFDLRCWMRDLIYCERDTGAGREDAGCPVKTAILCAVCDFCSALDLHRITQPNGCGKGVHLCAILEK